ncbi:MAG: ATP-binding protein [Roseobacter sp.]
MLAVLVVALVQLNRDVYGKIDALASANSDSTQWSLAQSDVELLALLTAVAEARADPQSPLSTVRTRFDIFYSRARTLFVSPLLNSVREDSEVIDALARLDTYLAETVPLIDGDDTTLRASLETVKDRTHAARVDVRAINLKGINVLSRDADLQRGRIAQTLSRVSILTFALFAILAITVFLLLHFFRDAQQRASEQSQIRSRLDAILSTSLDAVVAVNQDGKIIGFSGAAEEIFGYSRDEALGQQMEDLIVPDHLKSAHQAGMERYRTTHTKHVIGKGRVQLQALRKNGDVFPVELSIATAESDEGEIFVSFLRDISRRIAAEKELIQARDDAVAGEKAKADLIAVMSHEMRTPLNGMLGTLELLDTEAQAPKDRKYLDIIRESGKLLLHHVDNVLQISRAEAGKIDLEETSFSVPALIRELVESQRSVAEHRGNALSKLVDMQGDDYATGDPTRIRQVLLNLIGNAIKFTRNGSISVEAKRMADGATVEFRVTDTGIGIPADAREKIFEDFVTLDPSFSRAVGGTGLGLAIVRRLVHAMRGEVGLESSSGYGSSFWVHLPLPVASVQTPSDPVKKETRRAADRTVPPMKILVVEDNQINRIVVHDLLVKDGHTVDLAFDGHQGVESASNTSYDLVFMDISMPVMDGIEATREIRATEPAGTHLPIVALTANAIPSEKDRYLAAGLDDILIKPITARGLREILNRYSTSRLRGPSTPEDPQTSAGETMVDHGHLGELIEALGSGKIETLVASFLDESGEAIATIAQWLEAEEAADGLLEKVHHTAGSAALLGAEVLRASLADLENRLAEGDVCNASDAKMLRDTWSKTAPELRLYLKTD